MREKVFDPSLNEGLETCAYGPWLGTSSVKTLQSSLLICKEGWYEAESTIHSKISGNVHHQIGLNTAENNHGNQSTVRASISELENKSKEELVDDSVMKSGRKFRSNFDDDRKYSFKNDGCEFMKSLDDYAVNSLKSPSKLETGIDYTSAINLGREEGFFKDARRIFKPKKTQPSQAQKGKSIIVDCINEDRPIINKNHNSPPT